MFNVIDSAVASPSTRTSKYADLLSKLALATKNEEGQFVGPAADLSKVGEVLSLRAAAKVAGVGLVTRKQKDGKTRCWKVAKADVPVRKPHAPRAKKGSTKKA